MPFGRQLTSRWCSLCGRESVPTGHLDEVDDFGTPPPRASNLAPIGAQRPKPPRMSDSGARDLNHSKQPKKLDPAPVNSSEVSPVPTPEQVNNAVAISVKYYESYDEDREGISDDFEAAQEVLRESSGIPRAPEWMKELYDEVCEADE